MHVPPGDRSHIWYRGSTQLAPSMHVRLKVFPTTRRLLNDQPEVQAHCRIAVELFDESSKVMYAITRVNEI